MTVKDHYEKHLAKVYSWMAGDFDLQQTAHGDFFKQNKIFPQSENALAIDLGAGHGIQSIALASAGFRVIAVDFSDHLLSELEQKSRGLAVETMTEDIRNVHRYARYEPELIVCMGDTLTHLENIGEIKKLLRDCVEILNPGGKIILSFRDYRSELKGNDRFIPVKNDGSRILTAFLEYFPEKVRVTDLLHEKNACPPWRGNVWELKVSSYDKVRLSPDDVTEMLKSAGMLVEYNDAVNRMWTIIATKKSANSQ